MNIIFLDIDGPMIPERMYYDGKPYDHIKCSFKWDPVAVGMINTLCRDCNARVVFNSMHNNSEEMGGTAIAVQAAINGMFNVHSYHPHTQFAIKPDLTRLEAIEKWLDWYATPRPSIAGWEVEKWVVFDDYTVINDDRQIKVDFKIGITWKDFAHAKSVLTGKPVPSLFV